MGNESLEHPEQAPSYSVRPTPEGWIPGLDLCNVEPADPEARDALHKDLSAIKARRTSFIVERSLADILPTPPSIG